MEVLACRACECELDEPSHSAGWQGMIRRRRGLHKNMETHIQCSPERGPQNTVYQMTRFKTRHL